MALAARGSVFAACRPAREARAKFVRNSFFIHSGIAMNLSPSLYQKTAIPLDLRKSSDHIPAGQPVVRHYPGPFTLVPQRDPRLGARTNDVHMRRAMIVRVDHHPQPPKPKNGPHRL